MKAGEDVLLFGEGTSSDGEGVLAFKPSHFAAARDLLRLYPEIAEVTVQPAAIAYLRARQTARRRRPPRSGLVRRRRPRAAHLELLKSAPVDCLVSFGAPLAYRDETDRKAVAMETEARVRSAGAGQSTWFASKFKGRAAYRARQNRLYNAMAEGLQGHLAVLKTDDSERMDTAAARPGGRKKLFVKSFGCQMNAYDAARMADVLAPEGYEETSNPMRPTSSS